MKVFTRVMLLLLFSFSCTKRSEKKVDGVMDLENEWKAFFQQNQYEFSEFKDFIRVNYIENKQHEKSQSIDLLNCANYRKDIPYMICDERAIDFMKQLDIREVAVEREYTCEKKEGLNEIYFKIERKTSPQIVFIYSYCEVGHYFENSNIKFFPLNENWGLQFEN